MFEIAIIIILVCLLAVLCFAVWTIRQAFIRPIEEAQKKHNSMVQVDVENAKICLDKISTETRMEAKVTESQEEHSIDKLRNLRRK